MCPLLIMLKSVNALTLIWKTYLKGLRMSTKTIIFWSNLIHPQQYYEISIHYICPLLFSLCATITMKIKLCSTSKYFVPLNILIFMHLMGIIKKKILIIIFKKKNFKLTDNCFNLFFSEGIHGKQRLKFRFNLHRR